MPEFASDIEIARAARKKPIQEIGARLGIPPEHLLPYGHDKAKVGQEFIAGLKDRPEARNLVNIYAALADETPDQVLARFEGQGFGAFKPALADIAVSALSPITAKMTEYMDDPAEIDRVRAQRITSVEQELRTPAAIATRTAAPLIYGADSPYAAIDRRVAR